MKVNNPTSIPINKLEVNDVIKYNEIKWKIYEIFHDTILIRRYHMIPGSYSDNYKWLDRDTLVKRVK